MKDNCNTTICCGRVKLVPYRKEHVTRYHQWMQDQALQEATASEPLTLEEEYEMQASWAEDPHKCTFILLDRDRPDTPGTGCHGGGMCGDINLFLHEDDGDDDDDAANQQQQQQQERQRPRTRAELSVMVAEASSRRRGLAESALRAVMAYAAAHLGVAAFEAKIGYGNGPSLALFGSRLGFREVRRVDAFQEATLEWRPAGDELAALRAAHDALELGSYDGGSDCGGQIEQAAQGLTPGRTLP